MHLKIIGLNKWRNKQQYTMP